MKKKTIRRLVLTLLSVLVLLVITIVAHVYLVTRQKVDAHTRVLARIDIHNPIDQKAANDISTWLYRQAGVDHVLCNQKTSIAIFSFSPLVTNANDIVTRFAKELHYPHALRYTPSAKELQTGCPAVSSYSYRLYSYLKHIF